MTAIGELIDFFTPQDCRNFFAPMDTMQTDWILL